VIIVATFGAHAGDGSIPREPLYRRETVPGQAEASNVLLLLTVKAAWYKETQLVTRE